MSDFSSYRRFLNRCAVFAFVGVVITAPAVAAYVVQLKRVGELLSGSDLIRRAKEQKYIWLSGYCDAARFVKLDAAVDARARVVALGSSRCMQIRDNFFHLLQPGEFYNLGGAVSDPMDATRAIDKLVAEGSRPELAIIAVDWWWFQSKKPRSRVSSDFLRSLKHSFDALSRRWKLCWEELFDSMELLQNAWRDPRFRQMMMTGPRTDSTSERLMLGTGSHYGGFRNDGSFRYRSVIQSPRPLRDRRAEGLQLLESGQYRGNFIKPDKLDELERLLKFCNRNGIKAVMFLPPLDQEVVRVFRTAEDCSAFWVNLPDALRDLAQKTGAVFKDFTDSTTVGAEDEEFVDWFHGSEKLYARLILALAADPDARRLIGPFVDTQRLREDIGRAISPLDIYGD